VYSKGWKRKNREEKKGRIRHQTSAAEKTNRQEASLQKKKKAQKRKTLWKTYEKTPHVGKRRTKKKSVKKTGAVGTSPSTFSKGKQGPWKVEKNDDRDRKKGVEGRGTKTQRQGRAKKEKKKEER